MSRYVKISTISDGGNIYALNSPSENRAVSNHLGIYTAPLNPITYTETFVYADFENGNESTFNVSPGYSGSTYGINKTLSTADAVATTSYHGSGCQRISIVDDPAQSGGWFVRHNSGATASRSVNTIRPTEGHIGFWARTFSSGCKISIAIDNTSNITADRGVFKSIAADDCWHLYEWDLEDDGDWEGWASGDGIIDTADFTIDSIQITNSSDTDAVVYIDEISHSTRISLAYLFALKCDFEPDGDVDLHDFALFAAKWMSASPVNDLNRLFDVSTPYDEKVNILDLKTFTEHWLDGVH